MNMQTRLSVSVTRRGKVFKIGVLSGGNWAQRALARVRLWWFNRKGR